VGSQLCYTYFEKIRYVLRVLELNHPEPLTIKNISQTMVDINSNVSRLVDKLVVKKLVERHQEVFDKRKVKITITEEGLKVAKEATVELIKQFTEEAKSITTEEANLLSDLLDKLRS
jgi:DNA-binding MarR family transcriptional regulator